jgi:mono/diheme cytochrome c family protein
VAQHIGRGLRSISIINPPSSIINHPSPIIDHQPPIAVTRALLLAAAGLAMGCSAREPKRFELNLEGRDPATLSRMQVDAVAGTLERLFGTPDAPKVPPEVGLDLELLRIAAGPLGRETDEHGRPAGERGLYQQHCAVCHGITGEGAGPLAALLRPYPRDFRNGVFKFTSTESGAKAARDDLRRALEVGNADTAMPTFATLPDDQIEALVEYVEYLSLRGETELFLRQVVVDEDEYLPLDEVVEDGVLPVADLWAEAAQFVIEPPGPRQSDTPQQIETSLARGRDLYLSETAKCVQCHGQSGRGDGEQSEELYDDWNKPKKGATPAETQRLSRLFPLPIQRLRPRDFTRGTFHGGHRPIDLYWRVAAGIKGTPMPPASRALEPKDIWDLVHYVRSLGGRMKEDG